MKSTVWITLVGLAIGWQVNAATLQIVSPDAAQTFACGSVDGHHLYWNDQRQALCAYVTFSNRPYAGDNEPPRDESFVFDLPGVRFDSKTRRFVAKTKDGPEVPVATLERGFLGLGSNVKPLQGTMISISNQHGEVTVVLTAIDFPIL